jgi:hypothetical protein
MDKDLREFLIKHNALEKYETKRRLFYLEKYGPNIVSFILEWMAHFVMNTQYLAHLVGAKIMITGLSYTRNGRNI